MDKPWHVCKSHFHGMDMGALGAWFTTSEGRAFLFPLKAAQLILPSGKQKMGVAGGGGGGEVRGPCSFENSRDKLHG